MSAHSPCNVRTLHRNQSFRNELQSQFVCTLIRRMLDALPKVTISVFNMCTVVRLG